MIAWLGNTQARQLTELYRALRLYVNCCRTLHEIALQTARRGKSAVRLRPCEDPARAASCSQEYRLPRSSKNCSK